MTRKQLIGLLQVAYGLTAREREICGEVIKGYSTADIAGRLFISANTVQDHLKSVFAKVGVGVAANSWLGCGQAILGADWHGTGSRAAATVAS